MVWWELSGGSWSSKVVLELLGIYTQEDIDLELPATKINSKEVSYVDKEL